MENWLLHVGDYSEGSTKYLEYYHSGADSRDLVEYWAQFHKGLLSP